MPVARWLRLHGCWPPWLLERARLVRSIPTHARRSKDAPTGHAVCNAARRRMVLPSRDESYDGPEVSEDPQLSNAPTVIETPRPQPTDAEIQQAIAESQDYAAHKSAFLAGARALVRDGTCTVQQLGDYGGWVKSTTTFKNQPVYFTVPVLWACTRGQPVLLERPERARLSGRRSRMIGGVYYYRRSLELRAGAPQHVVYAVRAVERERSRIRYRCSPASQRTGARQRTRGSACS